MSSHTYDYLDGNAAAGELSNIFDMDVTGAEDSVSIAARKAILRVTFVCKVPAVARCAVCEHVLLRLVNARQRVFLDMRGMTRLILDTSQLQEPSR